MRTIELSNEKARRLAEMLAPQWALHATQLAAIAAGVNVNTPYRCHGERMDNPRFRRRVDARKKNVAVMAEVLTGLGATVPKVDASTFVVPYNPPEPRSGKYKMIATQRMVVERERLVKEMLAQAD